MCVEIIRAKYARLLPVMDELNELQHTMGSNPKEIKDNRKEFDDELKDWEKAEREKLKDLEKALRTCDVNEKKEKTEELANKKEEFNKEKNRRLNERNANEDRLRELTKEATRGVDGNEQWTQTNYEAYEERLHSAANSVIDQVHGHVISPYDTFAQKFNKLAIRGCIGLGHRRFYVAAQRYEYLAENFDLVYKKTVDQRKVYLTDVPRPHIEDRSLVDHLQIEVPVWLSQVYVVF